MRTMTIAACQLFKNRFIIASLLMFLMAVPSWAQQKTVTGTVRNAENGSPVALASVTVKGTKIGTTSNENGAFTLSVTEGQTLVVSAVGFTTMESKVGSQSVVDFNIKESTTELEGVVVTALGIKREEKALGYSVSKVKGEDITDAQSNNWTNALTGKVAGVNLVKSGGGPSGSNKIILRGENSLTG